MLTDKRLYAFKDLAVRFLRGEAINRSHSSVALEMEAVDASLGPDRTLLVVMPDTVYQPMIDTILAGGHLRMPLLRSDDELIEPFDETAWEQSEELELADVARAG